jgi:polyisoprenoid-binding protein YceI
VRRRLSNGGMIEAMRSPAFVVALALAATACGGSVQHAAVGSAAPHPSRSTAPARAGELRVDRARSRVEVAGSDRMTGEHVALIRDIDVELRGADGVGQVVIVADLRTLRMKSRMIEDFVKSEDFLDVERFPSAVFRSSEVERVDGDRYSVSGVLDLHGVARQIAFVARVQRTAKGTTVAADFLLPRQAFDIRRRDGWDFLISDDFRVKVQIAATRVRGDLASRRGDGGTSRSE